MDHNKNLADQLETAKKILSGELTALSDYSMSFVEYSHHLAKLVIALDKHIMEEGKLPDRWSKAAS